MSFEPDDSQAPVLEHDRGNLLVTGPPGSGKTSLLRERFARLVDAGSDPEEVALLVLNRRAARDAREQLVRRLARSLPALPVFTVHGLAFSILGERFKELGYEETPQVLSAPEQYAVVRELLLGEEPEDWPRLARLLEVGGFARRVADFCLRAQERLLDPDALEAAVERSGKPEFAEVAAFHRRYLENLAQAGRVDFAGLLFQALVLLEKEVPPGAAYAHLLVDDYQDATIAAERIVSRLSAAADTTVVAADPGGHVFSYRGGSLEPLERIEATLGSVRRVSLEASPRLGSDVAAVAALDQPEITTVPAERITARAFAHPGEEVEAVAAEILRARVEEDVPWEGIAVILRRYGSYLTALRYVLARQGIPFVVVAEAAEVAAEPANRPVIDLLRFVFRPERRLELVEGILSSPIAGLDPHGLRRLRREARFADMTLLDFVMSGELEELPTDLRTAVDRLRMVVAELPAMSRERGPDGAFFWLWTTLPHFGAYVVAEDRRRDLDALSALGDVLTRFAARRPDASIEDYLDSLEAAEFGPDPWMPPEERQPHAVRIVSAHRAQGSEFEVALVPGCVEGEFPSLGHGDPLLDISNLLVPKTGAQRLRERLAEERALFRLAISRARRRTVLFASRSSSARNPRTPSRFAARLGLEWNGDGLNGIATGSRRAMESSVRRTVSEPAVAPAERLAALAMLAPLGARAETWWGRRAWTLGPPLHPEDEILTSFSRLSALENCALQYLYQQELGLDPERTHAMWLGSLVHGIIEKVENGELEKTDEAVLAALEREWREDVFPNRAME
ncbi:MAG TPA: ATP-dependent DNA helicase, partial [Actinomycetota bacterium]|nr:ATP-dependent DNA helicase [Actinomycetota bacterium]